eukprot:INCI16490.1.p2 GENE.INCI16490.1~~INCI16490.1.p2  ORF type:complete len:329 (-),score=56.44 INCI16490.1:114-1100(-)
MLHVVLRRSLSAAPGRALQQLARTTRVLGQAGRSSNSGATTTTTATHRQLVASLHSESRLAVAQRRLGAFLKKEYTPSLLMVRARQLSTEASNAASAAKGGILQFPKEHPFATNIIIATIKTSLCDILVQKYVENKEVVDWRRVSVFTAFGCLYLGFFQWAIYVTLFGRLFPGMAKFANMPFKDKLKDTRGMLNVVGQTAFDNFLHYTFIYFPVFYVFKESIQGTGYEKTIASVTGKSLGKYRENFLEDNTKIWGLWIPGDLVIYAVPMWLRLPLNHALSFIWTCYLSFLRGDRSDSTKSAEEVVAVAEDVASGGPLSKISDAAVVKA